MPVSTARKTRAGNVQQDQTRLGWPSRFSTLTFRPHNRLRRNQSESFAGRNDSPILAAVHFAARALVVKEVRRQGNGTGKLSCSWPISHNFPASGNGHGIRRSSVEVHRLRRRVRFYCRRAAFLPRQEVHERPQALQAVQSKARRGRGTSASGNTDDLFRMRSGNNRAVQAYPGKTRSLPLLFSKETRRRAERILS